MAKKTIFQQLGDLFGPDISQRQSKSRYSLGNEERRTILKSIIESEEHKVTVRDVSSYIGFDGEVINRYLTELTSIGLLKKHKKDETTDNANRWSIEDVSVLDIINRLDNFTETKSFEDDEDEDEFKEW